LGSKWGHNQEVGHLVLLNCGNTFEDPGRHFKRKIRCWFGDRLPRGHRPGIRNANLS